jgi:F-type H+-transporting ATPase subunit a
MIVTKPFRFIVLLFIALMPFMGFSNETAGSENHDEATDVKSKIKSFIGHHVLDSHDFTLYSDDKTGSHVGFPLPIILWDNGLQFFMSSKFHHGEKVAESNGNFYILNHHDGKIYKTDNINGR